MRFKRGHQTIVLLSCIAMCWGCLNAQEYQMQYQTKTGKTIIIKETHPNGQSISNITIISMGFEYNLNETVQDADPLRQVMIADLDGNGFDEVYIFTSSAGSGSHGNVIAFSSNKDKSLSMINFPEILDGDKRFTGYMGHDSFFLIDRKLVRSFPVYLEGDSNRNPTGGRRVITYGLYQGEAAWQLMIDKVEEEK